MTKNRAAKIVPPSSKAIVQLQALPRSPDGKVFPIEATAVAAAFHKAANRAGLNDVHFHDLRHIAISRMALKLANVIELSAATGHKSLQMLKRYYHPKAEDLAL